MNSFVLQELLFFGDTWDHDLDRNPGFFDSGDPYGWTDADLDVFLTAPRIRWVVTTEPTYDQRGRRVSGPGYVPLLRGVLTDRELGGACGPLGAFYDAARDTAYVFFVAQVAIIPPDPRPPERRAEPLPGREDWCPPNDECVRLDRTVVVAARGVTSSLTDPPSVPRWEVVAQHTAAPLKAVAPVLVSREEIEPSWSREEALENIGVTARERAVADAPHHTRATPRSARLAPGTDPVVLMFASDKRYRHSKIVLARCPLGELDPRATNPSAAVVTSTVVDPANAPPSRRYQYLQWVDYSGGPPGVPFWTEDERLAMPLVDNETFGQPHVVREPRTGLWLMTDEGGRWEKFNAILLRWAPTPWGPWGSTTATNPTNGIEERLVVDLEPALVLFNGERDNAYGNYIHQKLTYDKKSDRDRKIVGDPPSPTRPISSCLSVASPSPRNQRLYVLENLGTLGIWPPEEPEKVTYDDGLSDAPFGDSRGAGYGAYLVPPWFRYRESAGDLVIDVVYTLATANPWQVQLLSTPVRVRSVGHHLSSQPWVHHERVSP